jgi:RsiW-degrading membrane proteinase PrsW (M82 family)
MRNEDKPFIYYKTGRWSFKIAPRNAAGVRATIAWTLLLAPIAVPFIWALNGEKTDALKALYIALYIAAMLLCSILMMRWMKARSEIVDFEELLQIKRAQDLAKKKSGR